jgi:hypothetical protein
MGTELRCYGRMSNYYPSTAILLVTLNIFYYLLTNESDRSFSTQKCLLLYIYICICIFTNDLQQPTLILINCLYHFMKRKFKQWWSTILPISTKRTTTSHLKFYLWLFLEVQMMFVSFISKNTYTYIYIQKKTFLSWKTSVWFIC